MMLAKLQIFRIRKLACEPFGGQISRNFGAIQDCYFFLVIGEP